MSSRYLACYWDWDVLTVSLTQLCGTTPCMVCGSEEIKKTIEDHLHIKVGVATIFLFSFCAAVKLSSLRRIPGFLNIVLSC
jgi:hypothetical protein